MGVLFFIPIMVIYVSEKVGDGGAKAGGTWVDAPPHPLFCPTPFTLVPTPLESLGEWGFRQGDAEQPVARDARTGMRLTPLVLPPLCLVIRSHFGTRRPPASLTWAPGKPPAGLAASTCHPLPIHDPQLPKGSLKKESDHATPLLKTAHHLP